MTDRYEFGLALVQEAGKVALGYFNARDQLTIQNKGPQDLASEADVNTELLIRDRLAKAFPQDAFLGEETPPTEYTAGQGIWVVDPIDGTRAFINHSKDWAHALAVVEDGLVISAVVYLPMHDLMFAATKDGGATVNDQPIAVTNAAVGDATVLGAKPNFEARFWKDGDVPAVERAFRSSLAYRLCLVAQGQFDGMITLRPSWEWDIAAGALIISEAGGVVSDQHAAPLRFNNPHPQVPGVLAAGAQLHAALAARLEPQPANT